MSNRTVPTLTTGLSVIIISLSTILTVLILLVIIIIIIIIIRTEAGLVYPGLRPQGGRLLPC